MRLFGTFYFQSILAALQDRTPKWGRDISAETREESADICRAHAPR